MKRILIGSTVIAAAVIAITGPERVQSRKAAKLERELRKASRERCTALARNDARAWDVR